jgi:hypothetical protein
VWKQFTRVQLPPNVPFWQKWDVKDLSAFIHGCSGLVGRELRFRVPENLEQALNIATTVYNALQLRTIRTRRKILRWMLGQLCVMDVINKDIPGKTVD